jgi:hypothetical protein
MSLSISIAYSGRACSVAQMRVEFDGGTLLLREVSEDVPYAEWDDRVEEYCAPAYRYRLLPEWVDAWNNDNSNSDA